MADYPRLQGTFAGVIGCGLLLAIFVLAWVVLIALGWLFLYIL